MEMREWGQMRLFGGGREETDEGMGTGDCLEMRNGDRRLFCFCTFLVLISCLKLLT